MQAVLIRPRNGDNVLCEAVRTHASSTNVRFITCYKMDDVMSTPINTITRENLTVLIANNILNNSLEFISDPDTMEMDSPIRKQSGQPISKKLFHSPMADSPNEAALTWSTSKRSRKAKKRKQILIPDNSEKIKRAYVKECEQDGYSPDIRGGMRKRVLISLFHNKEYCMDFGS